MKRKKELTVADVESRLRAAKLSLTLWRNLANTEGVNVLGATAKATYYGRLVSELETERLQTIAKSN